MSTVPGIGAGSRAPLEEPRSPYLVSRPRRARSPQGTGSYSLDGRVERQVAEQSYARQLGALLRL